MPRVGERRRSALPFKVTALRGCGAARTVPHGTGMVTGVFQLISVVLHGKSAKEPPSAYTY